jgi:hypothetical protein
VNQKAGPFDVQHTVTACLLRRFTNQPGTGRLKRFDLVAGKEVRCEVPPVKAGVVRGFDSWLPEKTERLWCLTETHLPKVFGALDDGTLLDQPDLVEIARSAIAVHYARSKIVFAIHVNSARRAVNNKVQELHRQPEVLDVLFYQKTGLYSPPGALGTREWLVDSVVQPFVDYINGGEAFHESLQRIYREVLNRVGRAGLHVATPVDGTGEFMIGDCPAVTVSNDQERVGPHNGVAIGDADTVLLPMGPKHVIALGIANDWFQVSQETVDRLNSAQMAGSIEEVYYRPGSGLGDFARMCWEAGRAA